MLELLIYIFGKLLLHYKLIIKLILLIINIMSLGTIQIPVLFDMSGDTVVFGEEATGDFVTSHLDFTLDMTTAANDISLNAADISSAILIGDQDTGDNIFYSGGSSGNIAVDNLCNRIAKAITRGKLVHLPKSGNTSNSGIPMGGRANLYDLNGVYTENGNNDKYAIKYFSSIAPIGDEQMLGQAMARVASVHLVGHPLSAGIFQDKNQIQTDLETASAQTFNSGNTAFYNALAVQLSKVLGGSKSSAPMKNGLENITTSVTFNNNSLTKIQGNDTDLFDVFGNSVAISSDGNYAIVGAQDTGNQGAAYIFDISSGIQQLHKLTASDAGNQDKFGSSVAIDGNYAIVGAMLYSNNNKGAVYVFNVTTGNEMTGGLYPSSGKLGQYVSTTDDYFGSSVAISGNKVIVGAKGRNTENGNNYGAAYIFDVTNGNQLHELTPSDPGANQYYGQSVAISGDKAIVGRAKGDAAFIFDVTTGNQLHRIVPNDWVDGDDFGIFGVAISGNYALVGSRFDDDNGSSSGSAYVFDATTGNELRKITPNDGAAGDKFGHCALSGNYGIIGAYTDDTKGSAYIFDVTTGTEIAKLTDPSGAANDEFGYAVGIGGNGTKAIVGARYDDDNGQTSSGSAFIITGTTNSNTTYPLDASGTSVPALKSIYEQLMNVPGRSQIMETRDISGVVGNANTMLAGGFPFIPGDKLVMFLRPKINFAAQTQPEQHSNAIVGFPDKVMFNVPVYNIADISGSITSQTYSQSSAQDNSMFGFHRAVNGLGVTGDYYWTSAGGTYSGGDYIGDKVTRNIGLTKNITVTTARLQNNNQIVDTADLFIYGVGFVNYLNIQVGDTVTYEHPTLGSQTTTVSQVQTGGAAPAKPYMIVLTDAHNVNVATPIGSCTFHNKKEGVAGEWGQVNIGASTYVQELSLTTNNAYEARMPVEFMLLGSNDGTNWTKMIHATNEVHPWTDSTPRTFSSDIAKAFTYYRYVVIKGPTTDGRTSLGYFNLKGSLATEAFIQVGGKAGDPGFQPIASAVENIPGLITNFTATAQNIEDAFPGNATTGPEAEPLKWGWMGSTNSDTLSLDTTDIQDNNVIDLHIWKITITL
jgi:hypothetical protein